MTNRASNLFMRSIRFQMIAVSSYFSYKNEQCVQVRMSPDHMTAYVLWEANETETEATRQALSRRCASLWVPQMEQCELLIIGIQLGH